MIDDSEISKSTTVDHEAQETADLNTYESDEFRDPSTTTELVALGTKGLATYDESIPDGGYHAFYIYHQDLESLSLTSDIIFTGKITKYIQSALAISRSESIGGVLDVYDGIVFTVDELISGQIATGTQEITVLVFALLTTADGTPIVRISDSPVEVVRSGIEQRNIPGGPRYLVFASQEDDPSSPFYRSDFYYFNTPGSIVQVNDDGTLGVGVAKPLNTTGATVGENSELINALRLRDVRGSVQVTQENNGVQESNGVQETQPQNDGLGGLLENDSTPGGSTTE